MRQVVTAKDIERYQNIIKQNKVQGAVSVSARCSFRI